MTFTMPSAADPSRGSTGPETTAPESDGLEEATRAIVSRREDPYAAASRLFQRLVGRAETARRA